MMLQTDDELAAADTQLGEDSADECLRRIPCDDPSTLIEKEWLVTNGLGGYASGTLAGAATRRYHGLLIAAHPAPLGRIMFLSHLAEQFRFRLQELRV